MIALVLIILGSAFLAFVIGMVRAYLRKDPNVMYPW